MKHFLTEKRTVGLLLILYAVGIVGLSIESVRPYFQLLTPVMLLLNLGLLLLHQKEKSNQFWLIALLLFVLGYGLEIFGVQTGLLFGEYAYGETLGLKILGTPPMIGVNWLLCVLSVAGVFRALKASNWVTVLGGASLLTFFDFVLEPVAIQLDFWSWNGGVIPLQNYVAWWSISVVLLTIFQFSSFKKENPLAAPSFALLFAFFAVLQLLLH